MSLPQETVDRAWAQVKEQFYKLGFTDGVIHEQEQRTAAGLVALDIADRALDLASLRGGAR